MTGRIWTGLSAWVAAAALTTGGAQADDIGRLQAASEGVAVQMKTFMIGRVPGLEPMIPPTAWDEADIEVGRCTLGGLAADGGPDRVEGYVAAMESWAKIPITSMQQMAETVPEALRTEQSIRLAQDCGGIELANKRLTDSGLASQMLLPPVRDALMKE